MIICLLKIEKGLSKFCYFIFFNLHYHKMARLWSDPECSLEDKNIIFVMAFKTLVSTRGLS